MPSPHDSPKSEPIDPVREAEILLEVAMALHRLADEAMERARPVIAASIGGLEDLVREGETGLLVEAGDADSLAAAMLFWISGGTRRPVLGQAEGSS